MKVSLILPAMNEASSVDRTLQSVFAQTRKPDEIVIGDGGSTDGTVERIRAFSPRGIPIKIQYENKGCIGAGRNVAIAAASHDVIAAADFGTELDERWLEEILAPFEEDPHVDLVAGTASPPPACSAFERCVAALTQPIGPAGANFRPIPKRILAGGNSVAFRKEIWSEAGGFPEWIKTAEDKLFTSKVHRIGGKVVGTLSAVVQYDLRHDFGALFQQFFTYGRGNAQSGQVSKGFWRLLVRYVAAALLLVGGLFRRELWVLLLAGVVLHIYRSGVRPYRVCYGGIPNVKEWLLIPAVVFVRNAASIAGHVVGYYEWLFDPRYRRELERYMSSSRGGDQRVACRRDP